MEIKEIKYLSSEYEQALELRDKILRKPLGMKLTEEFCRQDKEDFIFGIFEKNRIRAILHLKPLSDSVLKMRQVAVDNTLQGKGYGSKLVMFSERFARNNNYKKIVLHARKNAVPFYLKLNYKITSDEFYEIGILHFNMEKTILHF